MFVKGVSGNPGGRPKGLKNYSRIFSDEIIRLCVEQNLHKGLVARMAKEALKGDMVAAKFLIERIEGRATQRVEIDSGSKTLQEVIAELSLQGIENAPDA